MELAIYSAIWTIIVYVIAWTVGYYTGVVVTSNKREKVREKVKVSDLRPRD